MNPLPGHVLRAGHGLGFRHWGSEAKYDMPPKELIVYVNVINITDVI